MSSINERPSLRQSRQLTFIAEFTTDIRYVKGETNFVADAMSWPSVSVIDSTPGTTLRLPGEFTQKYTADAHTNLDNYSDKLRVAMSRLRLCPPRDTHQKNIFQYKEIDTCTHVYLRRIAIAPPLTAPYDGPYKVIVRSGRVMKILIKGEVETVSLYGIRRSLIVIGFITEVKQRRARFIIGWVTAWWLPGAVYTRGAQRTT